MTKIVNVTVVGTLESNVEQDVLYQVCELIFVFLFLDLMMSGFSFAFLCRVKKCSFGHTFPNIHLCEDLSRRTYSGPAIHLAFLHHGRENRQHWRDSSYASGCGCPPAQGDVPFRTGRGVGYEEDFQASECGVLGVW